MGWVGTNALETKKPMHREDPKRTECMSPLPLRQFKPGQLFYYQKPTNSPGFNVFGPAKFVRIERGMVIGKYQKGWTPTWMDERSMAVRHPGGIIRLRPTSCCLWGKGRSDLTSRCHWFLDLDHPVEDMIEPTKEAVEWMENLLAQPQVKNLLPLTSPSESSKMFLGQ